MKKLATQLFLTLTLTTSALALNAKNALGLEAAPTENINSLLTPNPVEYNIENNNEVLTNTGKEVVAAPDSTKLFKIQSYFHLNGINARGIDGGLGGGLRAATQEYIDAYTASNDGVLPEYLKGVQTALDTLKTDVGNGAYRTAFTNALYGHVDAHMKDANVRMQMIQKAQAALVEGSVLEDVKAAGFIATMVDPDFTFDPNGAISPDEIKAILVKAETPAPKQVQQAKEKVIATTKAVKEKTVEKIEVAQETVKSTAADIKQSVTGGGKLKYNKDFTDDFKTDGSRVVTPVFEKPNGDGVYVGIDATARTPEAYYATKIKGQDVKIGASTFSDGINPNEDGINNGNVVTRNPSLSGHTEGLKDLAGLHLNIKNQDVLGGTLKNTAFKAGVTTDGQILDIFKEDAQFAVAPVASATTTFEHNDIGGKPLQVNTALTYQGDLRADVGAQYTVLGDEKTGLNAAAYLTHNFNANAGGTLITAAVDAYLDKSLSDNFNLSAAVTPYWKSNNTLGVNTFLGIEKGIKVSKETDAIKVDGVPAEKKIDLNAQIGVQATFEKTPNTDGVQRSIGPIIKIGF